MNAPNPSAPNGNETAVEFLQQEVHHAQVSLKRAQMIGIILVLLISASMTYLVGRWKGELSPHEAAKTALEQLSAQVTQHGDALSDQLKEKAPQFIASIPDEVLKMLPDQREELEKHLKAEIKDFCLKSSKDMDKHLDSFFEAHKDEIIAALKATDNKEAMNTLGVELQDEIIRFLSDKSENEESIKEKIDKALDTLKHVETRIDRLANAQDLTAQEKKARRAVAILTHHVDQAAEKPAGDKEEKDK